MSDEVLLIRLNKERKMWKRQSMAGFVAKPRKKANGSFDMCLWDVTIPGPKGSVWAQGSYRMIMEFPKDYPLKPPRCYFKPVLPHPNIYPSGTVCLSILNEEEDWKPSYKIKDILMGIQKLLKDDPNLNSPAQADPTKLYKKSIVKYNENVQRFIKDHAKRFN